MQKKPVETIRRFIYLFDKNKYIRVREWENIKFNNDNKRKRFDHLIVSIKSRLEIERVRKNKKKNKK